MKNFARDFFVRLADAFAGVESDIAGKPADTSSAVHAAFQHMAKAAAKGRKVMVIGNGGSASIASHIAVDLWKNGGVKALCFNDSSQLTCLSNDCGYEHVFEIPINMFAEKGDVLIAISSSGKSPNILLAADAALKKGCVLITMTGFGEKNPLRKKGGVNFFVPSDGYGYVETVHAALCHALVDCVIEHGRRTK